MFARTGEGGSRQHLEGNRSESGVLGSAVCSARGLVGPVCLNFSLLCDGCRLRLQMTAWGGKGTRLSFGPHFRAGDMVTVEVDALKKEVRFYRNQARGFVVCHAHRHHSRSETTASLETLCTHVCLNRSLRECRASYLASYLVVDKACACANLTTKPSDLKPRREGYHRMKYGWRQEAKECRRLSRTAREQCSV